MAMRMKTKMNGLVHRKKTAIGAASDARLAAVRARCAVDEQVQRNQRDTEHHERERARCRDRNTGKLEDQ
jgi:hypothetical protein